MTTTFKRFLFTALFAGIFSQVQAVKLEGTTVKGSHDSKAKTCHLTLSPGPHKTEVFNTFRDKYLKNSPIQMITISDGPDGQNEVGKESGYHHLITTIKSLALHNPGVLEETSIEISGQSPLIAELLKGNKLYVDIVQNLIHAREELAKTKALETNTEPGMVQRIINTVKPKPSIQEKNIEESEKSSKKIHDDTLPSVPVPHTPVARPLPPSGNFIYLNGTTAKISESNMSIFNSIGNTYYRGITFDNTVTGSTALVNLKYLEDSTFEAEENPGKVAHEMIKSNPGAAIRWYGSNDPVATQFPNPNTELDVINLIKDNGPTGLDELRVTIIGPDTSGGDIDHNTQYGKHHTSLEYANGKSQLCVPFGPLLGAVATDQLTTTEIYGTPQPIAVPDGVYYPVSPTGTLGSDDLLKQTNKSAPNEYSFYFRNIVLDTTENNANTNTLDSTGTWRTELSKLYNAVVADCPQDISFTNNDPSYSSVIADLENGRLDPTTTLTNLNTTTAPANAEGTTSQTLGFSVDADGSYDATQNSGTFVQALWFMNMLPKGKGEIVVGNAQSELYLTSDALTDKVTLTIGEDEYNLWNGVATLDSAASRKRVGSLLDKTIPLPTNLQIKKRTIKE
ncbi:MAG: hypothetical protein BGO07_03085 [Alphaproteobacteria bacterium 40-19]|nr:MAG: hypothetical protein BGO07_03085 [Alphaproteobacteria bacterium 40-19]